MELTEAPLVYPKASYQRLQGYEGNYEYFGNTTLAFVASEPDTTLYAVIDQAKYPLTYAAVDTFTDLQHNQVVFQRGKNEKIASYQVQGETFAFISADIEKIEMYPRRA